MFFIEFSRSPGVKPKSKQMNYDNANLNWEEFFIQEALELEEKMSSFHFEDLQRSRLRLSLDRKILDWKKYHDWFLQRFQCTSLKTNLSDVELLKLRQTANETLNAYEHFNFWGEDLVPLDVWDGHLIVLGIGFNENLLNIPGCLFILAEPSVLSFICDKIPTEVDTNEDFEALDLGSQPPVPARGHTFSSYSLMAAPEEKSNPIWDYISERHDEYSFEAKKFFSAYVVLKIVNNHTQIFKMDSDLEKKLSSSGAFSYDLSKDSPFRRILQSGISESINISQLTHPVLDFKYACITALKRSHETVGFLVGLKSNQLAETDQYLLEDLAKESS